MDNMNRIYIFDTTLRDGEQTPGVNLNSTEKLEIAKQLDRLGVDLIEAGFPAASSGDLEAVRTIAMNVKRPYIVGLSRAIEADIRRAWEALQYAEKPVIHTFISTSDIHMKYKLKMTREQVLDQAVQAVRLARSLCPRVEFSPEDGSRTDPEFLYRILEAVIDAGASIVNIPDTVGYSTPGEFGALIRNIRENVTNIDKAIISVHCHDDLGMAVANSLAAAENGASQIECTINGLGERAGNTSLEEIVMAIVTRRNLYNFHTEISTRQIYRTSALVSHLTGVQVQPNKAVVGANAFAHESGIHQHGMLSNRETYEIMTPESVGLTESQMVLGKHSGRHAFEERLKDLGYSLTAEQINDAFYRFKDLADRKKQVLDRDIEALINEKITSVPDIYELDYFQIFSGNTSISTSTVRIKHGEEISEEAACGDGPIDAVFRAIERATGIEAGLDDYYLKSITRGKDAVGEVTVKVSSGGRTYTGTGISTDIIEASAKAYINAINKLIYDRKAE